jgi:hypothetical protein
MPAANKTTKHTAEKPPVTKMATNNQPATVEEWFDTLTSQSTTFSSLSSGMKLMAMQTRVES